MGVVLKVISVVGIFVGVFYIVEFVIEWKKIFDNVEIIMYQYCKYLEGLK